MFKKKTVEMKHLFSVDQCGAISILLDALEKENNHYNRFKLYEYINGIYSDVKIYDKDYKWKLIINSPINIEIIRIKKKKLFNLI